MPDSTLDTQQLHDRFVSDLGDLVVGTGALGDKPLEVVLAPPLPQKVRAYVYNLTSPPGGRPSGEHKIQLMVPGQSRDERGDFDFSGDSQVIMAGYSETERVYVLWDAALHRDFGFSANVQVKGETVEEAFTEGLAVQERRLRSVDAMESVVVVPAQNLVDGLLVRVGTGSSPPPASAPVTDPTASTNGVPYRSATSRSQASKRRVFEVDPDLFDRATDAHALTQNALRDKIVEAEFEPLSPKPSDPQFDIAWIDGDDAWVAEVKSLTGQNEVRQIRYAIGQVFSYCFLLDWEVSKVTPVIALERQPSDQGWADLCTEIGIHLVWPRTFDRLFD